MSFPNGLRTGRYRIIETAGSNTAYELLYDGKTVDGSVAARYFKVGNDSVTVSMYNPAKLSLSLKKEDLEGTAVSGYNFTLHKKGESGTYESNTEANGIAQFDYVDSGTYWMSESGSGYSSAYLEEYCGSLSESDCVRAGERRNFPGLYKKHGKHRRRRAGGCSH